VSVRVANAAGSLDDLHDVAPAVVENEPVDYVTLCYLSEEALPPLACARYEDPLGGHVPVFADAVAGLCPAFFLQGQLKLITDAGGTNARACAEEAGRILSNSGSAELPIAVVTGDDVRSAIEQLLRDAHALENVDTGQPFEELTRPVIAAHAWLGARPIADALAAGSRIVITGPASPAAPLVGLSAYENRWKWDDWDRLASATVAGKLLAGGTRLAGGDPSIWENDLLTPVGYPLAEIDADGSATITTQVNSSGGVTRETVVQQLLAGVRNPLQYETPDVTADLGSTSVTRIAPDCVEVRGAKGSPAADSYAVSVVYQIGFMATALLWIGGRGAAAKAKSVAELLLGRIERAGFQLAQTQMRLLGSGAALPCPRQPSEELREVVLHLAARDDRRTAIERFVREVAAVGCSGPPGVVRLAGRPGRVEPALAVWPTRLPKDVVQPNVIIRSASQWGDAGQL
jgi:hypothetical protein